MTCPLLIRHYEPEAWLDELRTKEIKEVRLTKVSSRHPYLPAWSVSLAAGFIDGHVTNEVLWYCGAETGENAAAVERLYEDRLEYLRSYLRLDGVVISPGRYLTELEPAL